MMFFKSFDTHPRPVSLSQSAKITGKSRIRRSAWWRVLVDWLIGREDHCDIVQSLQLEVAHELAVQEVFTTLPRKRTAASLSHASFCQLTKKKRKDFSRTWAKCATRAEESARSDEARGACENSAKNGGIARSIFKKLEWSSVSCSVAFWRRSAQELLRGLSRNVNISRDNGDNSRLDRKNARERTLRDFPPLFLGKVARKSASPCKKRIDHARWSTVAPASASFSSADVK